MIDQETDIKDIDDAELLLPWYVAGTLSDTDRARVDEWISSNPEAEQHLARAIEEHETVLGAGDDMPMPSPAAINDLFAAIGIEEKAPRQTGGWLASFWEALSPRYAMAGAAALALFVVAQAITIGVMSTSTPERGTTFETASGAAATADEATALFAFQPNVTMEQITEYLENNGLRMVDGPKPGGIFVIAAEQAAGGAAALDELGAEQTLVRFYSASR